MNQLKNASENRHAVIQNPEGRSSVIVVCEHASCHIPSSFKNLGLSADAQKSHAAWDPGAMAVACGVSKRLDANLVASGVSRLVYDCNRPPSAPDAMPIKSEVFDVPGNIGLTPAQRQDRIDTYYEPFRVALFETIEAKSAVIAAIIVTIHSFTPIYNGQRRAVEIGVLHDSDTRLADAMLQTASAHTSATVLRNEPYGPEHGVTHTLKEHALEAGHLNVMLEIRNDLIETQEQQNNMAKTLSEWITNAFTQLNVVGDVQC